MTTTEDNEDQEALNVVAHRLCIDHGSQALSWEARAARILSELAEAGYTVVKTEWKYGLRRVNDGYVGYSPIPRHYAPPGWEGVQRVVGPWEPVPESDTLGGGEQ